MPMNRSSWPKDLEDGLNAHFGMAYHEVPEEHRQVFDINNSKKAFEEDVLEYGFGAAVVKAEGGDYTYDEGGQGWTARYTHNTIALGFAMTQEALEDNLYAEKGAKYSKALARALKHTKEIRCANVLNNAVDSGYLGGDGKSLLSTLHPLAGGGVASNMLATPADLSETSLEDVLIMVRKAKDDRGVPIAMRALRLVLPPELEFTGDRITMSTNRSGTADNDINAIRAKGVFNSDAAVITRLTDPDAWGVKTDAPEGLKLIQRVKVQRGTTEDYKTGNMIYTARERYSEGWTDWRGYYGSQGG
jgi:hypothetical protein